MANPGDLGHIKGLDVEGLNFQEMTVGLSDRGGEGKDEECENTGGMK